MKGVLFLPQAALTAVSSDEAPAVGKFVYGKETVIVAVRAAVEPRGKVEREYLVYGEHIGMGHVVIALFCYESRAESAHYSCYIGAYRLYAGYALKAS